MKVNGREVEFGVAYISEEANPHERKQQAMQNLATTIEQSKGDDMWDEGHEFVPGRVAYTGQVYVFTKTELQAFVELARTGEVGI